MKQIQPGQSGWLQLALSQKTPMVRGDRFVLRRPSPATTLGGGKILDPQPGRQHRRFRPEVITRLETLAQGKPEELLLQALASLEPTTLEEAEKQSGLEPASAVSAWQCLVQEQKIKVVGNYVYSQSGWDATSARLKKILGEFHSQYPLRVGIAREELRSRMRLTSSTYNPLVEQLGNDGLLAETGTKVHLRGHEIRFDSRQEAAVGLTLDRLSKAGVNSPGVKKIKSEIGDDLYAAMIELGLVRQISNEVLYASSDYELIIRKITSYLKEHDQINAAQVRDLLDTSRKYAIALLEHMDDRRITRRVGDNRVLNG
jgi:selenocysteine-specific elongation factor